MHLLGIPVAIIGLGLLIGGHFADEPRIKACGAGLLMAGPVILFGFVGDW